MATGQVVRFDDDRGYGFIAPDDGGEDVFVHANDLTSHGLRISAGTQVQFNVIGGERGLKAYDVRVVDGRSAPASGLMVGTGGGAGQADGLTVKHVDVPAAPDGKTDDDELSEVFSKYEFTQQVTDIFLETTPELTGAQITKLRERLLEFATKNGWAY